MRLSKRTQAALIAIAAAIVAAVAAASLTAAARAQTPLDTAETTETIQICPDYYFWDYGRKAGLEAVGNWTFSQETLRRFLWVCNALALDWAASGENVGQIVFLRFACNGRGHIGSPYYDAADPAGARIARHISKCNYHYDYMPPKYRIISKRSHTPTPPIATPSQSDDRETPHASSHPAALATPRIDAEIAAWQRWDTARGECHLRYAQRDPEHYVWELEGWTREEKLALFRRNYEACVEQLGTPPPLPAKVCYHERDSRFERKLDMPPRYRDGIRSGIRCYHAEVRHQAGFSCSPDPCPTYSWQHKMRIIDMWIGNPDWTSQPD